MVFKTVEGLKDAVASEEHTVKGKKVREILFSTFLFSQPRSQGGSEEGAGEAGQSVRGQVEG